MLSYAYTWAYYHHETNFIQASSLCEIIINNYYANTTKKSFYYCENYYIKPIMIKLLY